MVPTNLAESKLGRKSMIAANEDDSDALCKVT